MDKLVINGGRPLKGQVRVSGAKNAVLPIMAATLLARGEFVITNVPDLRDVQTMAHLLRIIGAKVTLDNHRLTIDSTDCSFFEAPYELVKTMRASIYVLGPLLARFGEAKVSLPGGCAIGTRPVDLHIKNLAKLGAEIDLDRGYIHARAKKLVGARTSFDISSVGATGNVLMAAVLAQDETIIDNAAREPEIIALATFLVQMGAKIEGIGTSQLRIRGVKELKSVSYDVIPDRIEAGTFMIAGAMRGNEVSLSGVEPKHVESLTSKLREAGVAIEVGQDTLFVKGMTNPGSVNITTSTYPGFPTDLQAQWMTLMSVAGGPSIVTETIFSDRFMHVAELRRLGAQIELNKNIAFINGVDSLKGAQVMSTDLRASASLVLAGLVAEGRTDVHRVYHLDRGYERIEHKLQQLGADIHREDGGL